MVAAAVVVVAIMTQNRLWFNQHISHKLLLILLLIYLEDQSSQWPPERGLVPAPSISVYHLMLNNPNRDNPKSRKKNPNCHQNPNTFFSKIFQQNPFIFFWVILHTNKHTQHHKSVIRVIAILTDLWSVKVRGVTFICKNKNTFKTKTNSSRHKF